MLDGAILMLITCQSGKLYDLHARIPDIIFPLKMNKYRSNPNVNVLDSLKTQFTSSQEDSTN